jgi:hypothetical protein
VEAARQPVDGWACYELELPGLPGRLEPFMCAQWCVLMGPWLGVRADAPGVLDGVLEEVAAVRADVLGLAEPPVDANATPATPPPSPAATAAVITSRRIRPELDAPIRLLLPFGPQGRGPGAGPRARPALFDVSLPGSSAGRPSPGSQRALSRRSRPGEAPGRPGGAAG